MHVEARPTAVTVIGWAWIVIGITAGVSVLPAVGMSSRSGFVFFDAALAGGLVAQVVVSGVAIVSGRAFLKQRPWSRRALEVLTWLLLFFVVAFSVVWLHGWVSTTAQVTDTTFSVTGALMGVATIVLYTAPLVLMLRSLRSEKVRKALLT